jgi:transposase InsO family protein
MMVDAGGLSVAGMRVFLAGAGGVEFELGERTARWGLAARVLARVDYAVLGKGDKGVVRRYLERVTGLGRAQVTRLIGRWRREHELRRAEVVRECFPRRYTRADIELLARVDEAHEGLSGASVRRVLQREFEVYGRAEFERLAGISVGHIYNLRKTKLYRSRRVVVERTAPQRRAAWAQRRRPEPGGAPGWLRVDTVHQGRQAGRSGPYHINAVDTVTQWEVVGCCQTLSEKELRTMVAVLLEQFPFRVRGFHSDNGGEYINRGVGRLLERLQVEFTASRPSRTTDNALVEGKNGAVVRKWMGWGLLGAGAARQVERFFREEFNPYLNFHRPCGFAEVEVDARGRRHRRYRADHYRTPFEQLSALAEWEQYLKPGVTRESLERTAQAMSDTEAARRLQVARQRLFAAALRGDPAADAPAEAAPRDTTRLGGASGAGPLAPHPTPPNTPAHRKEAPPMH